MSRTTPDHPRPIGPGTPNADDLVFDTEPPRDEPGDTVTSLLGKKGTKAQATATASRTKKKQGKCKQSLGSPSAMIAVLTVAVVAIAVVRHRRQAAAAPQTPIARAIRLLEEAQRRQRKAST